MSVTTSQTNTELDRFRDGMARVNFGAMLAPTITRAAFERSALSLAQRDPKFLRYDRRQVFMCLSEAAEDGLRPDGREGVIIEMGGKLRWFPMVYGLIKLAVQSGAVKSIQAHAVYSGEHFKVWLGMESRIEHERDVALVSGDPVAVYAVMRLPDGDTRFEVMSWGDVQAIRKRSRAGSSGPWVSDPVAMGLKTVVKRALKYMPMSMEVETEDRVRRAESRDDVIDMQADPEPEPQPIAGGKLDALEHMADDVPDEAEPPPFYPDPQREAADIIPGIDDAPAPRNGTLIEAIRRVAATTHPDELEDLTSSPKWKASVKTLADDAKRELNDAVNAARRRLAASVRNADIAA